eukprot:CCRYP_013519-RA/>CCRYP_013519-RA protein AED:0.19 eAED:0.19 QI:704/1/1/1/0.5/0.2/5/1373/189
MMALESSRETLHCDIASTSQQQQRSGSNIDSCGYVTYFLSNVFAILYFLWAFLPDEIVKCIDEQYGTYYPPREIAIFLPSYLVLLFIFVPILYMGMNMLSAPRVDDTNGIWDTHSNECVLATNDINGQKSDASKRTKTNAAAPWCHCTHCDIKSVRVSAVDQGHSVPSICDLDVSVVNRYMQQQLKKLD